MKINRPKTSVRDHVRQLWLFFMAWSVGTPKWINDIFGSVVVRVSDGHRRAHGPAYFPFMLAPDAVLGAIILAQSMTLRAEPAASSSCRSTSSTSPLRWRSTSPHLPRQVRQPLERLAISNDWRSSARPRSSAC